MNQPENQDLDVDALMRQIRLEIASRTARAPASRQVPYATHRPRTGERDAFDGTDVTLPRLAESVPAISRKSEYTVRDFLNYHDEDFVRNAYRGLLGREPDAEGARRFLTMLRTGDLAKIEILGRMRLSPEGRAAAVRVTGLLVPFTLRTLRRIPVLGHVLGVLQYVLRLPIIVRNHERLEAVVFFQQLEMRRGINAIDAEIEAALRRFRDSTATSIDGTRETILAHDSATSASFDRLVERLESITERVEDKIDRPEAMAIERRIRCEVDMLVAKFMSETTAAAAAAKADIDRLADELSMRRADAVRTDATREDPDNLLDDLYVSFEDTFRGTREDIKKRVEVYLPYIRDAGAGTAEAPVLDIGCGRGEWLELLEDNGLAASGVDTNRISSAYCRERGLVVAEVDNLDHLRGLESASIGAVTAIHVIEHIPFPKLMLLFDEVRRVLKPGGVAIFETPNPENLVVGACNFWYDPTHQQPLPPEPMRFVLDNRGFTRVEILRLHPMTDMSRLTEASIALPAAIAERFYGPQDYALVGYKP